MPFLPATRLPRRLRSLFLIFFFLVTLACATVTPETSSPTPYSADVVVNTPTPDVQIVAATIKGSAGSTIILNGDGTTLFVDERAGYSLTVPAGWLAIRINEQEYQDAFLLPQVAIDETLQRSLKGIQNKDPNVNRLFIVDLMDGHRVKDLITNVNIIWDEPFEISLDDETAFQTLTDEVVNSRSGLILKSSEVLTLPNGSMYGAIQVEIEGMAPTGETAVSQITMAVFDLPTGTLSITLTTEISLAETVFPIFNNMLNTLKFESNQ